MLNSNSLRSNVINNINNLLFNFKLDAILIYNKNYNPNFFYILQNFSTNFENSFLIIEKNKITLVTSEMDKINVKKNIEVKTFKEFNLYKGVKKYRRVGIDLENLPSNIYLKLKDLTNIVDISEELMDLRSIKEEYEIEKIKKATRITEKVLEEIYNIDFKKFNECKLKAYLEYKAKELGAMGFSFNTIVSFDENTKYPHYNICNSNKYPKSLFLVDIGIIYEGYTSDITRFFILEGNKEVLELAKFLLDLQERIINKIESNIEAKEIDLYARREIERKYKKFLHSLGHGIGLEIHEKPFISPNSKDILRDNMVFTIEPGVYLENFGLRFEDVLTLKNSKPLILSNFLRELDELKL